MRVGRTEELAELHAIIQAIEYQRHREAANRYTESMMEGSMSPLKRMMDEASWIKAAQRLTNCSSASIKTLTSETSPSKK